MGLMVAVVEFANAWGSFTRDNAKLAKDKYEYFALQFCNPVRSDCSSPSRYVRSLPFKPGRL